MHAIKKVAVGVLITAVVLLTFLAILSIWDVLQKDVLWKSITSIGVVGFAALIVVVAAQALEKKDPVSISRGPSQSPMGGQQM